jgi:hypothetical protein
LNTKVVSFGCGPWRWYEDVGKIHMNKGRVGEERRGKEMDGCPLTIYDCPKIIIMLCLTNDPQETYLRNLTSLPQACTQQHHP